MEKFMGAALGNFKELTYLGESETKWVVT